MAEPHTWQMRLQQQAQQRRAQNLWRQPRVLPTQHINFCSNDYLGLSQEPRIIAAYQLGLQRYGCGSGGSPLISGFQAPHQALSEKLAAWLGRDAVLLTGSGYAANYAVANVLDQLEPVYFFDKCNHASMYDAIGLNATSGRKSHGLHRFRHNDVSHLKQLLAKNQPRAQGSMQQPVIASEGIFSMDGDALPLHELIELRQKAEVSSAPLIWVDDAHGIGVTGEQGAGVCAQTTSEEVAIVSATFGKAFGMSGAFVAGDHSVIEAAWQQARHYIYSTAFSAAQAEALSVALDIISGEAHHQQQLAQNIDYFKQGLIALGWRTESDNRGLNHAIQPVVTGSAQTALTLGARLAKQGIACLPIRPPTVAPRKAGVRVTLRANHSITDINQLLDALGPQARFVEQSLTEATDL